ncbi:alpha/beta hydrolase [Streptomyces sp. NPDC057052]|uniref:alpha/beta hydrolase n=1 Tax=Streptomyces sp. NPDC057052 TaxID=3346010 RepID=UPI00363EB58D
MDLSELKALKPSEYAEAADGYRAVSGMADTARERIDKQITKAMQKANEGEAADAAQKQLKKLSENFHYTQVECGLISGALNGFSSEIAAPRRRLLEALQDAEALAYTVSTNGDVTYPAGGKNELTGDEIPGGTAVGNNGMLGPGNRALHRPDSKGLYTPGVGNGEIDPHRGNPHHAKAQHIADRIAHALREAAEIDERYSKALEKLKAAPGLSVDTKTWADVASDADAVSSASAEYLRDNMPLDKSPADIKKWWDGLSGEERDEYKRAFPELIGNLDGIPAEVRDEANRENLPLLIASMESKGDDDSRTKLGGLKRIQERLNEASVPPMYLLGIGDEGNGRAIISYGNPDTSKNVSAYVPGLDTKLDESFANGTVNRAFYTAKLGREMDPSTASIVWLGYDAPQMSFELLSGSSVASANNAEHGAPAYNSFMGGIAATNENADPHITAIGHSYGSRLVGAATQMPGGIPGADDIILVGSPGTGVDKASDLGVGKGHVWVGAAENDIVTKLPSMKENGGALLGGGMGLIAGGPAGGLLGAVAGGSVSDSDNNDLWFGKDPASEEFGANRFKTLPGPTLVDAPDVWNSDLTLDAHSNYFNPEPGKDQVSARNIAAIVAGEPGYVSREKPR